MLLFFCIFEVMIKKFFEDVYVLFKIILQQIKQGSKEIKSIESDNHNEIYLSKFKFLEFKRENLTYPKNTTFKNRFLEIYIEFYIDEKGYAKNTKLFSQSITKNKFYYPKIKIKKTKRTEFLQASEKLIEKYKGWIPYKYKEEFVEKKVIKSIQFFYHKDYFNKSKEFCLNPDQRAFYKNKENSLYQNLIHGKGGCDGIIQLICIVEKDGTLTNFEFISIEGKGIQEWALEGLDQLGKWEPAIFKGIKVRSQLDLRIYT